MLMFQFIHIFHTYCAPLGSYYTQLQRIQGLVNPGGPPPSAKDLDAPSKGPPAAVAFEIQRARYSQKTYMFVQGDASERFGLTAKEISSIGPPARASALRHSCCKYWIAKFLTIVMHVHSLLMPCHGCLNTD